MYTHYDEEILGEAADRLYRCARIARIVFTIIAGFYVFAGTLGSLATLGESYGGYAGRLAGMPAFVGWLMGLLFFAIGHAIAFFFRLRAQVVLATVQTERNTRRGAMLTEIGGSPAKSPKLKASDLPPYPQPELNASQPLFDFSALFTREGKIWSILGVYSFTYMFISFLTTSGLIGLIFGIGAGGALFWYLQLRDQGVADPLAVMRERTSTVVGNATEAVRTSAQTMATPREQPPAPPPPPPANSTIYCSSCGTSLPADASFCGECGTKVT